MAVHQLLLRGMLVGLLAGLIAFGFSRLVGEPSVERAIAFESAHAHHHEGEADEPELFSRPVQANLGLPFGEVVYGGALGGLFALLFAIAYGRFGRLSPRACAVTLAAISFVAVFVVPYLKYPANPPSVGDASTIGMRTGLYFSMIGISIVATMTAFSLKRLVEARLGSWNASLLGVVGFVVLVGLAAFLMPPIDEVPQAFPASMLWQFRLASLGTQAVLWAAIGLLFGTLTERSLRR